MVIAVDNTRLRDGVPTLKTDWWNYGGLTRDVSLIQVPEKYIDDFDLHLQRGSNNGNCRLRPCAGCRRRRAGDRAHSAGGYRAAGDDRCLWARRYLHPRAGLELWSPEHPKLYRVEIQAGNGPRHDTLTDEIGFRTIEVRGTEILLNGTPIFLRGVSIHGEAPMRGGRPTS